MGFRIHCDACGSYMKTIGIRTIRDMNYHDDDPTHCVQCTSKFAALAKRIDKLQNQYVRKLDALAKKAQKDMEKMIADSVEKEDAVQEKEKKEKEG